MIRFDPDAESAHGEVRRCAPGPAHRLLALQQRHRIAHETDRREGIFHETDRWLIDGQQRLTALDHFFDDRLQVFGCRWSEVDRVDQMRVQRQASFTAYETKVYDGDVLRELLDRLNHDR